jgi:putative ABC transport system permease protein
MSVSLIDLLALTYHSLRGNPLRSCLTTLGIFMGVASVNATLQVGSISRAVIKEQLAKREAPQLSVYMWTDEGETLQLETWNS